MKSNLAEETAELARKAAAHRGFSSIEEFIEYAVRREIEGARQVEGFQDPPPDTRILLDRLESLEAGLRAIRALIDTSTQLLARLLLARDRK